MGSNWHKQPHFQSFENIFVLVLKKIFLLIIIAILAIWGSTNLSYRRDASVDKSVNKVDTKGF